MNKKQLLEDCLEKSNGLITLENAKELNVSRQYFNRFVKEKSLVKVSQGVYKQSDAIEDEYYLLQQRYNQIVFSHETALYFHQLTDRVPTLLSGTVKSGYHAASINNKSIKLFQINKELYEIGIIKMKSIYGNEIKVYNLERTICDIVRSRSQIEVQDFQSAMKSYIIRKDKDIPLLMRYAKMFKVDKILMEYLKVLL